MTPVLTPTQVAEVLGATEQWVTNAARSRVLPGRKVGRNWRFTESDIEAYLDRVQTGTTPAAPSPRRRRRAA